MEKIEMNLSNEYPLEDIIKTQKRLLEMAKITTDILDKHNFKYFITFGTLLGAVRHHGFVPWDDDFDLFLFDDEYDRAVECLRSNLPEDIIVHDKNNDPTYFAAWSKLRDTNSSIFCSKYPDENKHIYTGINLDLYRLKKVKRSFLREYIAREHIEFLVRKNDLGFSDEDDYLQKLRKSIDEYNKALIIDSEQTDDDVFAFVVFVDKIEINDVFPLKKYKFESFEFWGPNNADSILRSVYGNYLEFPPLKDRRPHCDYVRFLNKKGVKL